MVDKESRLVKSSDLEDSVITSAKIVAKAISVVKRDANGTVQWSSVGTAQGTGITGTGAVTTTITTTLTGNAQILYQKYVVDAGVGAKTININTIAGGSTNAQTTLNTTTSTTKTITNSNTSTTVKFQVVFKYTGITAGQTPFSASMAVSKEDRQGIAF